MQAWHGPTEISDQLRLNGTELTETALMSDSWPGNVCLHIPSRMSHSLADASQAPEIKVRMSGDSERDITSPVWPVKAVTCWPVSMSQRALEKIG